MDKIRNYMKPPQIYNMPQLINYVLATSQMYQLANLKGHQIQKDSQEKPIKIFIKG